jgi:hypothetical protein
MQHDEVIWQVINHQFCSFKVKCVFVEADGAPEGFLTVFFLFPLGTCARS